MSGIIERLNNAFPSNNPQPTKTITMQDIASVTTGSMTARLMSTVKLAWEGKVVNDKAVQKFLGEHLGMNRLGEISDIFEEHAKISASDGSKKEIKQGRKDAAALAKVFDKAASELIKIVIKEPGLNEELFLSHADELYGLKGALKNSQNITEGMKRLEQYSNDPSLLLRAAKFNQGDRWPIKEDFTQFLNKYSGPLTNGQDLNTAYSAFIKEKAENADRYAKDASTFEYLNALQLVKSGVLTDKSGVKGISRMSIEDLLKDFKKQHI